MAWRITEGGGDPDCEQQGTVGVAPGFAIVAICQRFEAVLGSYGPSLVEVFRPKRRSGALTRTMGEAGEPSGDPDDASFPARRDELDGDVDIAACGVPAKSYLRRRGASAAKSKGGAARRGEDEAFDGLL